jgi:hypothetical protein
MDPAASQPPADGGTDAATAPLRPRQRLALRSRWIGLIVAVLALVATASAVSYGLGRAAATVINACYKTATPHTLTVRDGATCPAGTTALTWNVRGPRGIQGIQGIQGTPGMSGFTTTSAATGFIPPGNIGAIDVPCPDGKQAISGGYSVPYGATVLDSHAEASDPTTWYVAAAFPSVGGTITAYVQCALVATTAGAPRSGADPKVTVSVRPIPH